MDLEDVAPTVGVVAAIAVVLALVAPYALLSGEHMAFRIGEYYNVSIVSALAAAFLSLLFVVVLLAGERGNADPDLAAGVSLALGVATALIVIVWAVSVPAQLVDGFQASWMAWHRWIVALLALVLPVSVGGYARAVL